MKTIILYLILLIIIVGSFFAFLYYRQINKPIYSYEECVEAGNAILESYPPQCVTKKGKHFTQNIGNELEKTDEIIIENPRPNQVISSPLQIKGKARGYWFFEASFPIILVDSKGRKITEGVASAQGEWMSENFVPYISKLEFETDETFGTLILMKDNPSGENANQDALKIPVEFKKAN